MSDDILDTLDERFPYYGRDGKRLKRREAWALIEDKAYRRVAETTLPSGRWVSTVWIGFDLNGSLGTEPPLIFETMVFVAKNNLQELACERWATLEEATMGHHRLVQEWKDTP